MLFGRGVDAATVEVRMRRGKVRAAVETEREATVRWKVQRWAEVGRGGTGKFLCILVASAHEKMGCLFGS